MATTKAVTVLDDDVTLTAAGGDHTSGVWTLDDGFGGQLHIEITNGGTGPTVAATAQVWVSPDNSTYYKLGGLLGSTLGASIVTTWSIQIPIGVEFAKVISGSNTGQNVVIRVEGSEVTALA